MKDAILFITQICLNPFDIIVNSPQDVKQEEKMHTYKIVYTIANKPGRFVTFYEAACADFARLRAYDDLGGWNVVTIWEVTEVNM